MFSSKPKDANPAPSAASSLINAVAAVTPAAQPRKPARGSAPSILSADAVITGTITCAGDMQIDGRVEDDVRSVSLVIGEKAEIRGEIFAEDVTIRVRPLAGQTRIDLRSASRFGGHDFGSNARRVQAFSDELQAQLDAR